jgi:hypothetical protein
LYALINDREIPVETLKNVITGQHGRILISGAAVSDTDRKLVTRALLTLHEKDVVSFNVVTSDWRAITGKATITKMVIATKSREKLPFLIAMKPE